MTRDPPSTTITTDVIKQICVKTGFYRNPVCNEKLYLHNKGFDSIEEGAFDPYTDVKVLWLEGNAFRVIPCGRDCISDKLQQRATKGNEDAACDNSRTTGGSCCRSVYVDCCADWLEKSGGECQDAAACLGNEVPDAQHGSGATNTSGEAAGGGSDVFMSLYPTLRQLYLHNNALRQMPDLSRFHMLDSVNLSSNCIHSVEVHCDTFNSRVEHYEEEVQARSKALVANSKSMQRELNNTAAACEHPQPEQSGTDTRISTVTVDEKASTSGCEGGATGAVDALAREEELAAWRRRLDAYMNFCPHKPLDECAYGNRPEDIPYEFRSPCSSLRTLNIASNYLNSVSEIMQLLCYKNLSVLDLSNNLLEDGESVLLVLERLKRLRSLKLSGNPLVRTLPRYRKTVLARCGRLLHLDDRPVFDAERRLVTAWARGGDEAEKEERQRMKKEEKQKHLRQLREFRELLGRLTINGSGEQEARVVSMERRGEQRSIIEANSNHAGNSADGDDDCTSSETGDDEYEEPSSAANSGDNCRVSRGGVSPAPAAHRVLSSNFSSRSDVQRETTLNAEAHECNCPIGENDDDIFIPPRNP
uniref:Uncharacterized protein n=1 Tax=Trypanosoma congolense (strain IL3000) TaxID=1068625 RepID=G0UPC7_TRYCI|nr:conserved hypothetical protein [Trypanosoma congolense IL3000]